MTPLSYYQQQCDQGLIKSDPAQITALQHMEVLYQSLIKEHRRRSKLLRVLRKPRVVEGLYLWGGVGIGKTFLMDCFYHCLPFPQKSRMHFHHFMQMIHAELKQLHAKKNPLQIIAKKMAQTTQVLCFDEFIVSDIVDAMLLARLFEALFAEGVCLVATSNVAPDDLYKRGLQRPLFLPAIALIKKHTLVHPLATTIDYRLRHLKKAGVFYTPNDDIAEEELEKCFAILADGTEINVNPIEIHRRPIKIKKQTHDIVWFDFSVICSAPRSQEDYLAIAKQYRTVFISHIPIISAHANDKISLFIRLIDVLYDARVRLVCSAAAAPDQLYVQGIMRFDYLRTQSRLLEMQSENYFTQS